MRQMIISYLNEHQCLAIGANGSNDMDRYLGSNLFSLVVLDIQLGQRNGFDILQQIRGRSDVPVILISGQRCDDIDRIVGLELGADDYLNKPFKLRELLARARAILRRQEIGRRLTATPVRGGYRFKGWELKRRTRTLIDASGEIVGLTKGEYALLVAFLEAPQRPLSREHLLRATRAHEDIFDRSIDVQVLRLRRKLEPDPIQPGLIRTERGAGYILDTVVEVLF